ncbi:MAG TPA: histidine kinase [Sphingobium sp.]|nr:histidine kinase [Sphingobium sp.]
MAKILLLSLDSALAQRIAAALDARASVDLVQHIDPDMLEGPAVIIIDHAAIPPERSLATAISAVRQSADGRPILLATEERDADPILAAVRAGADDIVPRQAEGQEVTAILARHLNGAVADHGPVGRLTLVMGVDEDAAAMAATDMAIVRARAGSPTLLIDCTLPTSAAQTYCDVPVSYGLASAIADLDRIDASLLSSTLGRHGPSGLMLLTLDGGTGTEPAGIAPSDICALVRLLRACCGEVILCAGSLRHSGLLRDLNGMADRVELVCAQSLRDLEASRRLLDRIGPDSLARTRLLVWDHLPAILLDSRRMSQALGIADALPIPVDRVRAGNARNAGQPLAMESDGGPYMQAIRRACGIRAPSSRPALDRMRRVMQRKLERVA